MKRGIRKGFRTGIPETVREMEDTHIVEQENTVDDLPEFDPDANRLW